MAALGTIGEARRVWRGGGVFRAAAPVCATALVLPVVALLFAWRRLAGALDVPLDLTAAACCSAALAVLDTATEVVLRQCALRRDKPSTLWLSVVPTVEPFGRAAALVSIAVALTLPGTHSAAVAALWIPTGALAARALGRRSRLRDAFDSCGNEAVATAAPDRPSAASRRLRQQTSRFVDAAGRDVLEGTAVAVFAPGQRWASVHLAFCPPFAGTPEAACGIASAIAAEVKAAQVLPYAARFDVKLSVVAATTTEVPISFSARCDAES